ncbi:MAG: phosphate acyltransferase PlsX, partial [Vibrio sp.]
RVTVPAAVQALSYFPLLKVILVGEQSLIQSQLNSLGFQPSSRLSIYHSDRWIKNDDKPSHALRHSQGTSMRICVDLVAKGLADACVSGGNTGALMAIGKSRLKLIDGIHRPALISQIPTLSGKKTWLLDLGANVACDASVLFQFAVMGHTLVQSQCDIKPRIALLNIGEEANKGNVAVQGCDALLKQTPQLDYVGFIEGDKIFDDEADVIVCDGFIGNVCLKSSEGVARLFKQHFKQYLQGWRGFIAKILFSKLFSSLNQLNPDQYNGASLLGLRGIVIKSHGQADSTALLHAIEQAVDEIQLQVPSRIRSHIEATLLKRHDKSS